MDLFASECPNLTGKERMGREGKCRLGRGSLITEAPLEPVWHQAHHVPGRHRGTESSACTPSSLLSFTLLLKPSSSSNFPSAALEDPRRATTSSSQSRRAGGGGGSIGNGSWEFTGAERLLSRSHLGTERRRRRRGAGGEIARPIHPSHPCACRCSGSDAEEPPCRRDRG